MYSHFTYNSPIQFAIFELIPANPFNPDFVMVRVFVKSSTWHHRWTAIKKKSLVQLSQSTQTMSDWQCSKVSKWSSQIIFVALLFKLKKPNPLNTWPWYSPKVWSHESHPWFSIMEFIIVIINNFLLMIIFITLDVSHALIDLWGAVPNNSFFMAALRMIMVIWWYPSAL